MHWDSCTSSLAPCDEFHLKSFEKRLLFLFQTFERSKWHYLIWHASSLSVDVVLRISHIFIVEELFLIDFEILHCLNQDQNGKTKVLTDQYLRQEDPMDC